jgi:Ca2+-binding RTX toxin-like protein
MPEIQLAPGARESDIIAAINALPEGGTIILPKDATISITTGLNISLADRDITIDLNGSTLRQDANVSVITARGKHPTPEGVTIGQDASGNTTITYSGTAPDVSFGSWIKVVSDDTLPGDHLDGSQPTRMGQAMEVLSVNGNTVTLRGALIDQAKYVSNVRATEYESGQLVIKNGEIVGDSGAGGRTAALVNLRNTVDAQVDDLFIHDASGTGISVVDGVNTQITDVNIKNLFDVPGALGIGVHSLSSLGTTVKGLYAENVTHATDDNSIGSAANSSSVSYYGGDIGMHVSDSVAYATRNFAYSWHSEAVNGQYDHVMAFNSHGFLMARGIGGEISDSGGAGNQRGIAFYQWGNGDGRNITVDSVTLKETQSYSTTAINNPQDNTITDSWFESYSYTAPLDPKYATTTNTAYVRTNSETLSDTITGTAADDLLLGAKGDDVISGGDGNDYIWGGEGVDTLTGGGGRDRFAFHATWATGDTVTDFQGGFFGDLIDLSVIAARYNWSLSLDLFANGYVRFLQDGADIRVQVDTDGGGAEFVDLTRLSNVDASSLGVANLVTELSAGQDLKPAPTPSAAAAGGTVYGTEGNDVFYASTQYPSLIGNGGDDLLFGSAGNNALDGGAGNDALVGEGGNDMLDGGSGADWLEGGTGDDIYVIDNTADAVIEQTGSGFDTIQTSISLASPLAENVEALTLIGAALNASGNALDNVIIGNSAANKLYAGDGQDVVSGEGGNDRLYGEAGEDRLSGGDGNDTLYGGDGNDILLGNAGADVLSGSLGYDTASYADSETGVVADLASSSANAGGAAGDVFSSIENLTGTAFADSLYGNSVGNVLEGGAGDDHLHGRTGSDTLRGGDGNDFLDGGARKDVLTGGAGEDTFHFGSTAEGGDTVTDFSLGDHIALSAAGFGVQGVDDFAFVLSSEPTTTIPTAIYNAATGSLCWDADGSGTGAAVHVATFTGAPELTHNDFLVI